MALNSISLQSKMHMLTVDNEPSGKTKKANMSWYDGNAISAQRKASENGLQKDAASTVATEAPLNLHSSQQA